MDKFGYEAKSFEVTEDHVKLLQRAWVSWEDCEFGAPSIDCKRPYGNSDVYGDLAEILWGDAQYANQEAELTEEQMAQLLKVHQETKIALQIFLRVGYMKPGRYVGEKYGSEWRAAES